MRRFDAFMSEPKRDNRDINSGLKQMHRGRVTKNVGRDVFLPQAVALRSSEIDGLLNHVIKSIR